MGNGLGQQNRVLGGCCTSVLMHFSKAGPSRLLVNASALFFEPLIQQMSITLDSLSSHRKHCYTSTCLVRPQILQLFARMSQHNQLFVFAGVVLPNDRYWMPPCLLLLHECAHVLWYVAFCHKECTSLGVYSLFSCDVPNHSLTE